MKGKCQDAIPLLGPALDGELPKSDRSWLDDHVHECGLCRSRQLLLTAQAAALREQLKARADHTDFSMFADRVMSRIAAEDAGPVRASLGDRISVWLSETFAAHRFALGAGGGLAAAAAVALVVLLRPPGAAVDKPAFEPPVVVAALDSADKEAQIDALEVYGQESTVLQFPGQTVIWVTDEGPRQRSAQ